MKIKTPHFVGKGLGVKSGKYSADKCPICNPEKSKKGRVNASKD